MSSFINAITHWRVPGVVLCLLVVLSACASAPLVPVATINGAAQAIAEAELAGARQYAGAELDEARQKMSLAERSIDEARMVEAERYANEARIMAELASARTESEMAARINSEMVRAAEALADELQRTGAR